MKYIQTSTTAIVIGFLLILSSCQKQPEACISTQSTTVNINESIPFTNCSLDAYAYDWTFNGQTLASKDITLTFTTEGTYEVTLTAYSKNGKKKSVATEIITATQPTGSVSFWQSGTPSYNITDVTIGGQTSSITSDYPSGISDCNSSGAANFTLDVGTYTFSAQEQGTFGNTWSGTVTITQDECGSFQLQ